VNVFTVARITATVQSEFSAIERVSAIMCGINEKRMTGKKSCFIKNCLIITASALGKQVRAQNHSSRAEDIFLL